MSHKFFNFLSALVLGAAASSMTAVAIAQTTTQNYYLERELIPLRSPTEIMGDAFYYDSHDYFKNIMIDRQFDFFFGYKGFPEGNYPENEIAWDVQLVNTLYRDLMRQQNESDPFIRVPDLPNPFNTSLRTDQVRSYRRAGMFDAPGSAGTEFVYDR